jgi:hypothetical protein
LRYRNKGSWDALTYDQVSHLFQYRLNGENGQEMKLLWMQACRLWIRLLTKQLAKKVSRGKVYAVDVDSNMIKQAKNNLKSLTILR